jgi:antitoxin (DNA-binding transcriptional repressor) of toxin-antitoxin stability system
MLHAGMSKATASIREIRTNFRSVKRKLEAHGEVVITDNGVPSFLLKTLPAAPVKRRPMPDYYARLVKLQPKPLSAEAARKLHEENRGDR